MENLACRAVVTAFCRQAAHLLHPCSLAPPVEILVFSLNLSTRPAASASRILASVRVTRKDTVTSARGGMSRQGGHLLSFV